MLPQTTQNVAIDMTLHHVSSTPTQQLKPFDILVSSCRELNLNEVLGGGDGTPGIDFEELSTLVVVGEQVPLLL